MWIVCHLLPPEYVPEGFFIYMRVIFLIDGFNLYHSIVDIEYKNGIKNKWLNITSLLKSYIPLFGKDAKLESIYFFTALRLFLQNSYPETILRHKRYIKVLDSLGIKIVYGRFKSKNIKCKKCNKYFIKHEEKETDVAIVTKLFELVHNNSSDIYVIVSGDTDLSPAIKTIKELHPALKIYSIFPCRRKNDELKKIVDGSFYIKSKKYQKHQLPDPVILGDGKKIYKLNVW